MSYPSESDKGFSIKKYVRDIFYIVLFIFSGTLIYWLSPSQAYLKEDHFERAAPLKRSCHIAMLAILNKQAKASLFKEGLVKQMKESNYDFFDFVGKESIFDVIKGPKELSCTVILKDRLGVRFLRLSWRDSKNSSHYYGRVVTDIEDLTQERITQRD